MDQDPTENKGINKDIVRAGMEIAGGAIPILGGFLSAAASAWSEHDQEKVNAFFKHWLQMLGEEIHEKEQTIYEIAARLDMHEENVKKRLESEEYQSLLKKAFRDWAAAESEEKRKLIRNILANAAATTNIVSDDVVRLFLDWLSKYSELHFKVIALIYNSGGITRREVWEKLGRESVREDSADADLFKLLFHDLSTGRVIRQHREIDYEGNFVVGGTRRTPVRHGPHIAKSAFDENEQYELTQLGDQFVHYAMTDLPLKISAPKK